MSRCSHTIICLSSQPWADKMWTNKQHIMSRLAKQHRVIYVNFENHILPTYLFRRLRQRPQDFYQPWRVLMDGVIQREDNLYEAGAWGPAGAYLLPQSHSLRSFFEFDFKVLMVKQFIKREGIIDPIVWVYHPGFAYAVDRLPRKLLVYDCVDDYRYFPRFRSYMDWISQRDETLCKKADLVFTTSQKLYDLKRPLNPENTHLVHNVGDAEHFKKAMDVGLEVPPDLAQIPRPILGFVGAVSNYKLNLDWLIYTAQQKPQWHIVLIGPVGKADPHTSLGQLKKYPNIHVLGHRSYSQLPSYLKGIDVAIIPYRKNQYTASVFPIKFFEFLATGKPVVISDLPALENYYDQVLMAATPQEFIHCCENALVMGTKGQADRITLAEQNSWPSRVKQLLHHVETKLCGPNG